MTRRHGRCSRGARLVAKVPQGRWRTLTFLAALRYDRITAPCVIDGPINGSSFRAYLEQFLVPTLSAGDVVIMDNLGSHKGTAVRHLIRSAGAKLFFLPRHSPISIRSSRSSPSSRPCCARPTREQLRQLGGVSASFSTASHPRNAPITSPMPVMLRPNRISAKPASGLFSRVAGRRDRGDGLRARGADLHLRGFVSDFFARFRQLNYQFQRKAGRI